MKFAVTILKGGTELIEAESEDEALAIAEGMEAEGSFFLRNTEILVEPIEGEQA